LEWSLSDDGVLTISGTGPIPAGYYPWHSSKDDITAVVIEEGMRLKEVAKMLEKGGVIRDAGIFKVQNKLSHYSSSFEAGTYTLNTSMTNEEIMAILSGESY